MIVGLRSLLAHTVLCLVLNAILSQAWRAPAFRECASKFDLGRVDQISGKIQII